jgi:hypothetical protein
MPTTPTSVCIVRALINEDRQRVHCSAQEFHQNPRVGSSRSKRLVGPPADMAPDDMTFATIRVAVRSYGLPDTLWNRARALGELAHDVTNYACLILSSVGLDAPIWPVRRR